MRKEARIYKARLVYYYTCSICKEQRQTYHKPVRDRKICRIHQEAKLSPGQEPLFAGGIVATGSSGGSVPDGAGGRGIPLGHLKIKIGVSHRKARRS